MMDKRRFFFQALLLAAISFLLRSVGVGAQIYISSQIGAQAVGISSLIGGVGGFAITLALSGIQLGCTRLVAQGLGNNDPSFVRSTLRCAIGHALFFGCFSCALLLFGSRTIGQIWLGDMRTIPSLRVMALTLPTIAISSCFSGYFIAVRRVWKSACVQVLEEILRIACTVFFLRYTASMGVETLLLALTFSNAVADVFSGLAMFVVFLLDRRRYFPKKYDLCIHHSAVMRKLLSVTMPVATAAYARSGLITLEHMLIPVGLQRYGQTHGAALACYGALQSMALPIILFPSALIGSFAGLLVPELTEAHVRGEHARIQSMMRRVFWLTLLFSVGTAGIMISFSNELGMIFYESRQVGYYIRVMAPLIPIMYMDSATDAMLKGLGEQVYSMKVNIFDASLSVILVWLLLPVLGIDGYIVTIYVTEILNAALSIVKLLNISGIRPRVFSWIVKPLLCVVLSTFLSYVLFIKAFQKNADTLVMLSAEISVVATVYLLLARLLRVVKKADVYWLRSFVFCNKKRQKKRTE